MSDIVLGTATRQNLLALQQINTDLGTTQNHLATGLAVSSALDDAVKFFQSQSLNERASDDRPPHGHGSRPQPVQRAALEAYKQRIGWTRP